MDIPRRHTTRREFLAGVASGAALAAVWPASSAAATTLTLPGTPALAPIATVTLDEFMDLSRILTDDVAELRDEVGAQYQAALDPAALRRLVQGRDHVSREIRFGSLMEQLPNPKNRITPAWDHLDAIGLPRPRIAFTVGTYVRDGMAAAKVLHERLFSELRATERNHSDIAFGAGHLIGTTAMGADPARSVVDADGRAHDVSNLFVAGSSVFPTEGTANPTLTLAALALRTADVVRRNVSHFPMV